MSMSKKDFIALADVIRTTNAPFERGGFFPICAEGFFDRKLISIVADFCQSQNPRFNRDRWLDYIAGKCGPNGGTVKGGAK